jgi:hypothetical protein
VARRAAARRVVASRRRTRPRRPPPASRIRGSTGRWRPAGGGAASRCVRGRDPWDVP